jgi:biopolymer transport protein ExbB
MKHFYSLIITGFLIPFLPLNAEMVSAEVSLLESVEGGEKASLTSLEEELSLLDEEFEEFKEELFSEKGISMLDEELKEELSLDEELALLDEEFEEFKEELFSLENDLQKQEKSSPSIAEKLLDLRNSGEGIAVFEEDDRSQNDSIAFDSLTPEIEDLNQIAERAKRVADSDFLPNIEIAEPIKELAIDVSKLPTVEKPTVKKEMIAEAKQFTDPAKAMTAGSSMSPPLIEKADLTKESSANYLQTALSEEKFARDIPATLNVQGTSLIGEPMPLLEEAISVDLKQAFTGSPVIYSLLLAMSVFAVGIWLYSALSLRSFGRVSHKLVKNLQNKLNSNNFDEALSLCEERDSVFCKMISSGIHSRRHGLPMMIEAMKAEGKRASIAFWQKIGLLNDIAIIAPMLGLLGTVLGMFYAFYDINRSIESVSTLFDGLGISVGTTVAGLIVAILALILHSTAKYRLVKALALIENEAQSVATLIDDRTSIYKGS